MVAATALSETSETRHTPLLSTILPSSGATGHADVCTARRTCRPEKRVSVASRNRIVDRAGAQEESVSADTPAPYVAELQSVAIDVRWTRPQIRTPLGVLTLTEHPKIWRPLLATWSSGVGPIERNARARQDPSRSSPPMRLPGNGRPTAATWRVPALDDRLAIRRVPVVRACDPTWRGRVHRKPRSLTGHFLTGSKVAGRPQVSSSNLKCHDLPALNAAVSDLASGLRRTNTR